MGDVYGWGKRGRTDCFSVFADGCGKLSGLEESVSLEADLLGSESRPRRGRCGECIVSTQCYKQHTQHPPAHRHLETDMETSDVSGLVYRWGMVVWLWVVWMWGWIDVGDGCGLVVDGLWMVVDGCGLMDRDTGDWMICMMDWMIWMIWMIWG